jgi:hypothetical protein
LLTQNVLIIVYGLSPWLCQIYQWLATLLWKYKDRCWHSLEHQYCRSHYCCSFGISKAVNSKYSCCGWEVNIAILIASALSIIRLYEIQDKWSMLTFNPKLQQMFLSIRLILLKAVTKWVDYCLWNLTTIDMKDLCLTFKGIHFFILLMIRANLFKVAVSYHY